MVSTIYLNLDYMKKVCVNWLGLNLGIFPKTFFYQD